MLRCSICLNPVFRRFPSLEPYQKIAADKIRKQQNQFRKNYPHNIIHKPRRRDNITQVTYQKTAAHDNKNIKNALHNAYQHRRFSSDAKHFSCFLAFDPNGFFAAVKRQPVNKLKKRRSFHHFTYLFLRGEAETSPRKSLVSYRVIIISLAIYFFSPVAR